MLETLTTCVGVVNAPNGYWFVEGAEQSFTRGNVQVVANYSDTVEMPLKCCMTWRLSYPGLFINQQSYEWAGLAIALRKQSPITTPDWPRR